MKRKKVAIIGAGISGLAAGWYLRQAHLPVDLLYLEKTSRAGGWIHTDYTTNYLFEKGPRAFKASKAPSILQLIRELDLGHEIVGAQARPHHRYLWHQEALHRFPTNPLAFLASPLTKGFVRALLTEWKQPVKNGDETVWEFVLRRFNYDVARLFFDPLVVGIFGGDIRKISVKACFPLLKQWEESTGSITKGFIRAYQEGKKGAKFSPDIPSLPLSSLFSLRLGLEMIPKALVDQMNASFLYDTEVKEIKKKPEGGVEIETNRGVETADFVIMGCPAKEAALLLKPHEPLLSHELINVYSQGIVIVNVGYDTGVLPVEGFGYLTSTYSNEDILGVVFDSSVFPEMNTQMPETRLTIKLETNGKSNEDCIQLALKGIRRHLNISRSPKAIHCKQATHAIPQYRVGHLEKMQELDCQMRSSFPSCYLVGNYISGVSVDACIARAKHVVQNQIVPAFNSTL